MIDDLTRAAATCFPQSYAAARAAFRGQAPGEARAYPSAATGPDGEPLWTDAAWIGPADAQDVLVVLSGVHGVEGYCGSGVQRDLMAAFRPNEGQALLLIHAVNPYGFAWDRRVTEEGCDLNRNFIDFGQPLPANPGYDAIAQLLLPRSMEVEALAEAEAALATYRAEVGELAFQMARKSGQYVDPKGMFFGGFGPSAAQNTLDAIAADYALASRRFVTILDIHTGLGPYGYGEAQSENQADTDCHRLATQMFGPSLTFPELGTSFSVPINGSLQLFWEQLRGDGRYVYICLEFGTFSQEASRVAYRLDHWHHAYGTGDPHDEIGRAARAAMRAQFYPEDLEWKEMVLFRSRQIAQQALSGMSRVKS
ncbi:DUF2817 domain-containing protein [Phenylobacterium sp.]|uniref:DUF2817 domain-containing protein n=1 Tax=Phenylobacterium sp. TaxID=1871053 RepID=UPI0027306561|nr:DUF2817 domain-containing protein [Phenylobacterium sp.]MDP1618062.1 DUF2817 domain-containing protein [Phenylobacterium sp.]MDP1987289.1 DUF2817 domain-containing protein [Phenylobacterium sp.]